MIPVLLEDVTTAIDRLSRVFPLPERARGDLELFARTWHGVLKRVSGDQLAAAVDAWLASEERFFPTPGKLLAIGRQVSRHVSGGEDLATLYRTWEQCGWKRHEAAQCFAPCPVCQAEPTYYRVNAPTGAERLMVLHVASEHWKTGVPFVGRARVGTNGGPYEWAPRDPLPQGAP